MAILVTGGAGYIGSVTVEHLRRRGLQAVVVDNLSRGHPEAVPAGVPLSVGDLTQPGFLDQVFQDHRIECVLHFAASSLVDESMRDPGGYFRNNVGGTLALLTSMVRHGVDRFVFSSSAATYGDPREIPIPESAPAHPSNPYGESKLICERMLHWFGEAHAVRWASLRYFNAAGATEEHGEDHLPETHLIPLALRVAAGLGGPLSIYGLDYPTPDGTCVRDYVHVEDLAEAHLLAMQQLDRGRGGIYNLGNGEGFSVLDVIRSVQKVTGREIPWQRGARRPGDPARLVAASERARRELGWTPQKDHLDVIVETAWRWMEAHPDGYPRGSS